MTKEFPIGSGEHKIVVHQCSEGGWLYEFYRNIEFGQLAVRTVPPGKTAGGHSHDMNEWWLIFRGTAVVRLEYPGGIRVMRTISGENPEVIPLPSGTGHDIKNVGEDDMAFIFWAEELYDPRTHTKTDWSWD